ncbi:MAG: hypothetical protein ABTQ34_01540 [Bdellovibrionales bacterium]
MRIVSVLALTGVVVLAAVPAMAGTLTFSGGQGNWKSTKCIEPSAPPSLQETNPETPASSMNAMMTQYNEYVGAMQAYMNCVSDEAQNDANTANKTIAQSAQSTIEASSQKISSLGAMLSRKK